ncbi:MAG: hypothetical protein ACI82A_000815 [Candidatus Azotimanducaceae bacterium]|jgi:hypothetical protein
MFSGRRNPGRDLTNDVFPLQNDTIVNAFAFVIPDPLCAASGFFVGDGFGGEANTCNRNGTDTELLIPEQERTSVMANFAYVFSEKVEFYS